MSAWTKSMYHYDWLIIIIIIIGTFSFYPLSRNTWVGGAKEMVGLEVIGSVLVRIRCGCKKQKQQQTQKNNGLMEAEAYFTLT
jgi:hypothetical protein